MFQDATLLPWLTARQNIDLALRLRGVARASAAPRWLELLDVVRLDDAGDRRPHELSGGMRQRVALARCLAQGTRIVAMDEPFGALDAMTRDHLHDEIERVSAEQRLTVLFVTHNMREAVRLADRVILMAAGRIVHEQVVGLPRPRHMDSAEVADPGRRPHRPPAHAAGRGAARMTAVDRADARGRSAPVRAPGGRRPGAPRLGVVLAQAAGRRPRAGASGRSSSGPTGAPSTCSPRPATVLGSPVRDGGHAAVLAVHRARR